MKMFDIMHTLGLFGWVWVNFWHWNCADKYDFIELSDLIDFCYDLSDTQDGLSVGEWDLYFVVNILSSRQGFRWAIQVPWALLFKYPHQV